MPLGDYEVPVLYTYNGDGTYSSVALESNSSSVKELCKFFNVPKGEDLDIEKLGLNKEEVDLKYRELRAKKLFEPFSNKMETLSKKKFTLTQWHLDMIRTLRWQLWIGSCRLSWGISYNDVENGFYDWFFNQELDYYEVMREVYKDDLLNCFPIISNKPKRPFGDHTYWYNELPGLGFEGIPVDEDYDVPDEIEEKLDTTYEEVYKALQCLAWYGTFK